MSLWEYDVKEVSSRIRVKIGVLALAFSKRRKPNFDSERIHDSAKTSDPKSLFDPFRYDTGLHWGETAAEIKTSLSFALPQ